MSTALPMPSMSGTIMTRNPDGGGSGGAFCAASAIGKQSSSVRRITQALRQRREESGSYRAGHPYQVRHTQRRPRAAGHADLPVISVEPAHELAQFRHGVSAQA